MLTLSPPPARGELFYGDSPEIDLLRYASGQTGNVFPFSSYPVNGSDLLDLAESLPPLPRREDQEELDRFILRMREDKSRGILLRGGLGAAYEQRLRSGTVLVDEGPVKNAEDFRRAYLSQSPFLSLGAGIGTFEGVLADARMDFRPPWNGEGNYSPDHNFIPLPKVDIGFNLMSRGTLVWNSRYLDVFFGRDSFHLGNPGAATLYPSSALPYQDGLRLFVPLGPFSFDYLLATIAPKKAPKGHDVDPNEGLKGKKLFGLQGDAYPSTILMALHRFQWNFGPLKAGIGGTVIYARSNNMFLMTDLLPVFIYHNADIRPNNLNIVFDLTWTLFRGFSLSATAGFDDISAKTFGLPDGPTPTIPAWILQAEYGARLEGLRMNFLLEGGYTHYLWGNYAYGDWDREWGKVPLARAVYRYAPNEDAVLLPLTSPYGPGVYWGRFAPSLDIPRLNLSVKADLLILSKLKEVNLVDTPYEGNYSVANGPRRLYVSLDLPLVYSWKNLEFSFAPALILAEGKAAFECGLGLRFNLEGRKSLSAAH